jgi:hypothetical protein
MAIMNQIMEAERAIEAVLAPHRRGRPAIGMVATITLSEKDAAMVEQLRDYISKLEAIDVTAPSAPTQQPLILGDPNG